MTRSVFISLNHRDAGLADALRAALDEIFGGALSVSFSSQAGAIPTGSNWYQWIVDQVVECDLAFVLITPNSVQAPWLMWESGAVFGAALAAGKEGVDKVWPIVFQLKSDEIPSPIRDSNTQRRYGDRKDEVEALILDLFKRYATDFPDAAQKLKGLDGILDGYMKRIRQELLSAPAVAGATVLEEWRERVRNLEKHGRVSEVKELQRWMEVTFGQDPEGPQPVDLSIHVHLGELYASNREYDAAIEQFVLARRMASRDIFILRRLGRFYLETGKRDEAWEVIGRIEELDKDAYARNAECAALKGRYYSDVDDFQNAAECYELALHRNAKSYYLANLAAESHLKLGDKTKASTYFQRALTIIDKEISDQNVWTAATKANAHLALGQLDEAAAELDFIAGLKPTRDTIGIMSRGLRGIADHLDPKPDVDALLQKLS